ncbi:MAG: glycosyl hydrolase [Monoraphidium minutum]|nr:MAG: glycosyl hydrolase [Monoraphidium minutum]
MGEVNDPNAPFFLRGRYHLFFQALSPPATSWTWGLSWGHASSGDLVTWRRLPAALAPTPGGPDADGCFSGCAVADEGGRPTLLYTGVVRRGGAPPGLAPSSFAVSRLCVETQLQAVAADPGDPDLVRWVKDPRPWLDAPPPGMPYNCWRDPFVLETPRAPPPAASGGGAERGGAGGGGGRRWRVLLGSGGRLGDAAGGGGWQLELRPLWEARAGGADRRVWECPLVAALDPLPANRGGPARAAPAAPAADPQQEGPQGAGAAPPPTHLFLASAGRSPALGWLGALAPGGGFEPWRASVARAAAPADPGGASTTGGAASRAGADGSGGGGFAPPGLVYAGCISLPRVLSLAFAPPGSGGGSGGAAASGAAGGAVGGADAHGGGASTGSTAGADGGSGGGGGGMPYLHVAPLPELACLRLPGRCWRGEALRVLPGEPRRVAAGIDLAHSDTLLTLESASPGCRAAGALLLGPPAPAPPGGGVPRLSATSRGGEEAAAAAAAAAGAPAARLGALIACDFGTCLLSVALGYVDLLRQLQQPPAPPGAAGGAAAGGAAGAAGLRVLGGRLPGAAAGRAVELRAFLDWSVLEVFSGCGAALATRAYLGLPSAEAEAGGGAAGGGGVGARVEGAAGGGTGGAAAGAGVAGGTGAAVELELVAWGGAAVVGVEVHEMGSAWEGEGREGAP